MTTLSQNVELMITVSALIQMDLKMPFTRQTAEHSPPSPGQGMCLWVLLRMVAQDGVRKVVLSSLERLLDLSMWTVTLYLQENSRPGRLM